MESRGTPEKPAYPMRINKYLARKGFATRRAADDLVARRKVTINGKPAVLGSKVNEGDAVKIVNAKGAPKLRYFAYHKPLGIIRSRNSETAYDIVLPRAAEDAVPADNLDKNAHGILILTNDGRVTGRLRAPETAPEEEYEVRTKEKLRANFRMKMAAGVTIEGFKTKPQKVTVLNENAFRISLIPEKNNQIRRICAALFQEVADLKRVRIGAITLKGLRPEECRPVEGEELTAFLRPLGLA